MQKTQAEIDVLAERERQRNVEVWTPEHDDEHALGELGIAAACYAANAAGKEIRMEFFTPCSCREADCNHWMGQVGEWRFAWPWEKQWWKPSDRRRDLVKAGALILAEIERIDRQTALEGK